jgi:hypothetical protein
MKSSKYIETSNGDGFLISLMQLGDNYLSPEALSQLEQNVEVLMVELDRTHGTATIDNKVLSTITQVVADVFFESDNIIICFVCDFLSPIPTTKKKIPCQEYRSRLFARMFERYASTHPLPCEMIQTVIAINGVEEKYYAHIIARREHSKYVQLIGNDIKSIFDK